MASITQQLNALLSTSRFGYLQREASTSSARMGASSSLVETLNTSGADVETLPSPATDAEAAAERQLAKSTAQTIANIPMREWLKLKKPARYLGNEFGAVHKPWDAADVRFCLTYPEVYEVGASNLGHIVLYSVLNEEQGVLCDRCYYVDDDMAECLRKYDQVRPYPVGCTPSLTHTRKPQSSPALSPAETAWQRASASMTRRVSPMRLLGVGLPRTAARAPLTLPSQ
eukprot:jgi/Mesen1/6236/ME000321S05306